MLEDMFREGYLIQQAGEKVGKDLIIGSLFEKIAGTKIIHDQYGVLNVGAEILTDMHNPKDIQVAVKSIEFHPDSGEENSFNINEAGKTVAVFILRCRENSIYGNQTAMQKWPDFFQDTLGFVKHIPKMGTKNIVEGKTWFANFRDLYSPEHSNKNFDHFEVAVPLAGLLDRLGVDAKVYESVVKQAEENEARDKGYVLAIERIAHSLSGLKRVADATGEEAAPPVQAVEEKKKGGGFFKKLFG
jgi:hypothetical protein